MRDLASNIAWKQVSWCLPYRIHLCLVPAAEFETGSSRAFSFLNLAPARGGMSLVLKTQEWPLILTRWVWGVGAAYPSASTLTWKLAPWNGLGVTCASLGDSKSVFVSKARGKQIHVSQLFFFGTRSVLSTSGHCGNLMSERSCLPEQMTYTTNSLWILASLKANQCHHTSSIKFPLQAKTFHELM